MALRLRITMIREREARWLRFSPKDLSKIIARADTSVTYDVEGGVYFLAGNDSSVAYIYKLPRGPTEAPELSLLNMGRHQLYDYATAIIEHDLIACLTT